MNNLLLVLDMSEEEQFKWLCDKGITDGSLARSQVTHKIVTRWIRIEFADLAFRLRDEAIMLKEFPYIAAEVYNHAHDYKPNKGEIHAPITMMWIWFATHAKPVHWIIASLIAKGNTK